MSEQIVTGNNLFTDESVRLYLTDRAETDLTHGIRFKKSLYDEQAIPNDVLFLQLYYVTVAVKSDEPADECFAGFIDEDLKNAFKTICSEADTYTYGALDWKEAYCDFATQLKEVRKVLERKKRWYK